MAKNKREKSSGFSLFLKILCGGILILFLLSHICLSPPVKEEVTGRSFNAVGELAGGFGYAGLESVTYFRQIGIFTFSEQVKDTGGILETPWSFSVSAEGIYVNPVWMGSGAFFEYKDMHRFHVPLKKGRVYTFRNGKEVILITDAELTYKASYDDELGDYSTIYEREITTEEFAMITTWFASMPLAKDTDTNYTVFWENTTGSVHEHVYVDGEAVFTQLKEFILQNST
ncbi:MAG: hypothetical protein IJP31_01855 [Lachnospiraceae bacterium]|nr:hypothetical protein [Lachnospiraceae bacterium]